MVQELKFTDKSYSVLKMQITAFGWGWFDANDAEFLVVELAEKRRRNSPKSMML
jgi:hypothetical protein